MNNQTMFMSASIRWLCNFLYSKKSTFLLEVVLTSRLPKVYFASKIKKSIKYRVLIKVIFIHIY